MMKLTIWDFKNLALISGKILFTQPLKLHENYSPNLFMSENFFHQTHFSSVPTPL